MRKSEITLLCFAGLTLATLVVLSVDASAYEQYTENGERRPDELWGVSR